MKSPGSACAIEEPEAWQGEVANVPGREVRRSVEGSRQKEDEERERRQRGGSDAVNERTLKTVVRQEVRWGTMRTQLAT